VAKGELVFTSFLFVTSVIIIVDTANITESNSVGFVGPKVFAFIVGGLMFFLSGVQIVAVLRGQRGTPESVEGGEVANEAKWKPFGLVLAGLVQYAVLLEIVGFPIAGTVLFFLVAKALGAAKFLKTALISLITTVIVFLTFTQGLQLNLPSGLETVDQIFNGTTAEVDQPEVINDDGVVVDEGESDW
jgi:putative tricarboxylic transport membrane protein